MRVRFVTPRYGPEVIGGAETGARQLAEHLVERRAWEVEVVTTCARDHITWANELPPGEVAVGGVRVRRFPVDHPRPAEAFALDARVRATPRRTSRTDARRWVELNGPFSTPLLEAVLAGGADVTVYYPYLYHPTVATIGAVPTPAVLHPAAHDEPALYLSVFAETFASADALVFQTLAERRVVQHVHRVGGTRQLLLGLGTEPAPRSRRPGGAVLGVGDRPYLVTVGRVDTHKGSAMLARLFAEYKRRRPGPLALAFVGPVACDLPPHPDVVVTGPLDEQDKWDVVRDALVSVSASSLEAFSLVVPEAWTVGVPVMVNALCGATREHCQRSGGGLWFGSYRELEALLDRLLADPALRRELGRRGRAYVERHYRWPVLIRRYERFLETVVARGRRQPSPSVLAADPA